MTKTIPLNDDVHKYLKKVQSILYDEYDIEIRLQDILGHIINDKIVGDSRTVAKMIVENNLEDKGILEMENKN